MEGGGGEGKKEKGKNVWMIGKLSRITPFTPLSSWISLTAASSTVSPGSTVRKG